MLSYKSIGTAVIEINMPNDFVIMAIMDYKREEKLYKVSLMLRHSQVFNYDLMEDYIDMSIKNSIHIKSKVTAIINRLYNEGAFQRFFDRYDYMLKCFDTGDETLSSLA